MSFRTRADGEGESNTINLLMESGLKMAERRFPIRGKTTIFAGYGGGRYCPAEVDNL